MRIVLISCKGYHTGRNDREGNWIRERFEAVYEDRHSPGMVFADRETGVNCLFALMRYAGGLTPLLDADGSWL